MSETSPGFAIGPAIAAATRLLLPSRCCVCGGEALPERGYPLCERCESEADKSAIGSEGSRCLRCGKPLVSERTVCTRCRSGKFSFDAAVPLYRYRGAVRDILLAYKARNRRSLSAWLAPRIAAALAERFKAWPVIPVPPRPGKLRLKGWDQVEDLAGILETRYGVTILRILERSPGVEQKALGLAARASNAKGRFTVLRGASIPSRAVVLDDVLTTGATLSVCADVLKAAGAETVTAVVIAAD